MSFKSYFTQPKNAAAAAAHTEAQRRESYQYRASIATWLLVGLGAVVAMISGETFSRITHGISDSLIITVYLEVILTAIILGFSRLMFQHEDRTLANKGFGTPPNKAWPAKPETIYTLATWLCFATLLTLVAVLAASLAHPAPRENDTGGHTGATPSCLAVCPSSSPAPSGSVKPPPESNQPHSPSPWCTHDGGTDPSVKGPTAALGTGSC